MENIFVPMIQKLIDVGFYDALIFVIALTLFYAILRKVKIFGESQVVNAVLAFAIAFLIFGFPVIVGFSLTLPLVTFFTQSFVWVLMFFVGMLLASFFYPELPKFLVEKVVSRGVLSIVLAIGITAAVLSGLISVFWTTPKAEGATAIPLDTAIVAGGVIVFIILLIIAGSIATQRFE